MEKIKVQCTSGINLPLTDLSLYHEQLKKHSFLEIERIAESILECGILFPIAVGKIKDKNYIVDGEATFSALWELKNRGYEIPDVPVVYVRSSEKTIARNILIGASVNHAVTETSLKKFAEENDLKEELKELAFSTSDLIDFHTDMDIGLYVDTIGGKFSEQKLNKEDFEGLLK